MLKVIGNKIYDTTNAECLIRVSRPDHCDDFPVYEKYLYRTAWGAYFTCCEVDPKSIWAPEINNERIEGVGLTVLSPDEGAALLIQEHRVDLVYKFFGSQAA